MAGTDPLRIVQLTVENVKRVKAVSITPSGDVVVLSGRNAQGKTSVLDSIWLALGGGAAKRGTEVTDPIRDGETSATAILDLGEIKVTRTWAESEDGEVTTKLWVESAAGTLSSPQSVLDALIGQAGFDPIQFTRLSDKEQVTVLAGLVDLPFDPIEFDAETAALFNRRTDVNREVGKAKAQVEAMPRYPNAPTEAVKIADLMKDLDDAQEFYRKGDELERELAGEQENLEAIESRIAQLEAGLVREREARTASLADVEGWRGELAHWTGTPEKPDVDAIRAQISAVAETNEQVDANARYQFRKDELLTMIAGADGLTAQIEARRQEKKAALAAATFPTPDLGFDEGVVTLKGLPFRQASAAEQVEASTDIAMAGNSRLKVITIRDGSLLDSEHMAILERKAAEKGYQIWIEKVDESGSVGVVIEDGMVKA